MLDHYKKIVTGTRLDKYGEFAIIDFLAKSYNYTHAQAFDLSWRESYTIVALNKETNYIEIKSGEMKRDHDSKK